MGIATDPNFASNRWFDTDYTTKTNGRSVNRVELWQLAPDGLSATGDRRIGDDIPVAQFHNGGRMRFGLDGMLYRVSHL